MRGGNGRSGIRIRLKDEVYNSNSLLLPRPRRSTFGFQNWKVGQVLHAGLCSRTGMGVGGGGRESNTPLPSRGVEGGFWPTRSLCHIPQPGQPSALDLGKEKAHCSLGRLETA